MSQFNRLKVIDVKKETTDTVSIAFELPDKLKSAFQFVQGQYLTLKQQIKGEDVRRSYSLCTSPVEGELRVAVKKIPNGLFSTYANEELKVGDELEVMPPAGNFYTEIKPNQSKKYVAFAAGSGITPIISILKTVLAVEPQSTFTLFYGNKTTGSIIFREEIEDLKNIYTDRLSVHHILSREDQGIDLLKGRIDEEKCQSIFDQVPGITDADEYFMCGPVDMIETIADGLKEKGVEKGKIHFELFTTAGVKKEAKSEDEKVDNVASEITLIIDGDTTVFPLETEGTNILDTALEAGVDVPFACKGAVCCTCRAKVLEGEVKMDLNYSLEEDEVEAGYVLTCQAHPLTEKVTVSFDD